MGGFLERFFAALCHQLPERSTLFGGAAMPLCARCAGLYLGALSVSAVLLFVIFRGRRPGSSALLFGLISLSLGLADGLVGFTDPFGNEARFLLGLFSGGGLVLFPAVGVIRLWSLLVPDRRERSCRVNIGAEADSGLVWGAPTAGLALVGIPAWGTLPVLLCFFGFLAILLWTALLFAFGSVLFIELLSGRWSSSHGRYSKRWRYNESVD